MARLVIGLGSSHSPMVVTDAPMWEQRAISDHSDPDLYDLEGHHCTYEDLERSGARYARECDLDNLCKQAKQVEASLDRLATELEAGATRCRRDCG